MGIRANFDMKGIHVFMQNKVRSIENEIVRQLQYLGEECVNNCKNNRGYIDDTGNLNSSIGNVIVANGVIISQHGFELVKQGNEGILEGESLARKLASEHSNGFVLIVVAGMDYAKHVETGGRNVLTSGELYAERELPKIIKQLRKTIEKVA